MTTIRKVNRRSGPVRVTQRGTRTTYPHANWRKEEVKTRRYHGEAIDVRERHSSGACLAADEVADGIEALLRAAAAIGPERFYSAARAAEEALA